MYVEVGDVLAMPVRINRDLGNNINNTFRAYVSATYNGTLSVRIDWNSKCIRLINRGVTGWTNANLRVTKIVGTVSV